MQLDIVRLWKNEEYRAGLSEEQLATLPESPIGEIELSDADLQMIQGGQGNSCNSNGYNTTTYDISCTCDGGSNYNNNGGSYTVYSNNNSSCSGSNYNSQPSGVIVLVIPASSCG